MNGYMINNGDISTMTPLQKITMIIIQEIIIKWKSKNKAMVVI